MDDIKSIIFEQFDKGNICIVSGTDLESANLEEFIKQPAEGILYDLNRNETVVLAFIDDGKWINDFAVAKVIKALKDKIEVLESKEPKLTKDSKEYLDWVKKTNVKDLTNSQHRFVEFLLTNASEITKIGQFDEIFSSVRKYLKDK